MSDLEIGLFIWAVISTIGWIITRQRFDSYEAEIAMRDRIDLEFRNPR